MFQIITRSLHHRERRWTMYKNVHYNKYLWSASNLSICLYYSSDFATCVVDVQNNNIRVPVRSCGAWAVIELEQ